MEQAISENQTFKWTNKDGEILDLTKRISLETRLSEENWYNFVERIYGEILYQEGNYVIIKCSREGYDIHLRKAW